MTGNWRQGVQACVKEVAGKLVGNKALALKGKLEHSAGKIQAAIGDVKEALKDATKGEQVRCPYWL